MASIKLAIKQKDSTQRKPHKVTHARPERKFIILFIFLIILVVFLLIAALVYIGSLLL